MSESLASKGSGDKVGALLARLREKRESVLPTRIQRIDRSSYTLSSGQQRIWFIDQLEPGNAAYNISGTVSLQGPLDVGALQSSMLEIVRRHDSLRTSFHAGPDGPLQVVAPPGGVRSFPLPVVDLSGLEAADGELRALVRSVQARPFDLERGPLLRLILLRVGPEEHVLLMIVHHIVSDGWSLGVLLNEARALYPSALAGLPSPLPALPLQYIDYAAWLDRWLDSPAAGQQLDYWKSRLAGIPDALELPFDRPRPPVRTARGDQRFFVLPPELRDGLLALAHSAGVTPFVLLLSAYSTLLYRLSGQEDIPIGTPIANRRRVELQDLIGFFVNTLVLRADLSGGLSFRALLKRLNQASIEAFENQDLPFQRLIHELRLDRSLSRAPLFQAAFALQNVPMRAWEMGGVTLAPVWTATSTAMFDLLLDLKDRSDSFYGVFEYSSDLFEATTIDRFLRHFQTLLANLVQEPDGRVAEAPLFTAIERQQMREWNTTPQTPASDLLHRRFEASAARTPGAVALVLGDLEMTYGELNARANQLAHFLRRRGIGPGIFVGICLERSFEQVISLLGTIKAGAGYLPLDPAYPSERWAHILQDSGIRMLLTQESLLPLLPERAWEVLCLDRDRHLLDACATQDPPPASTHEDLFYLIHTSGSTGRPKGVAVRQRAVLNLFDWYIDAFGLRDDDSFLLIGSIGFDMTQKTVFAPLLLGGRLIIPLPGLYDPAAHVASVERHGITRLNCTPSTFYPLVEQPEDFPRLASLRGLSLGGEPISLVRLESWRTSPWCRADVLNTYGPTECTDLSTWHRLEPPGRRDVVPIGRPLTGVQVWVVSRDLVPVPVGVTGHLCAAGNVAPWASLP